jgi:Ca-activated chloride channel homolog
MQLLWPWFLVLLGLLPLSVAVYVWALRRRRRFAVRFSSLALVRQALPRHSLLRRHLPFGLFLLALGSLVAAGSRPVTTVELPAGQATIILAIDVSGSMCATDIRPTRLAAAQAAALSFIQRQSAGTQIGIVAFAGSAHLVQPPTSDQSALRAAVQSLLTARGTAIGNGIIESLEAIAEINGDALALSAIGAEAGADSPSEIIVVLTDGVTTTGVPPLQAAQVAAERGIRVYTIGFGTANAGAGSGCTQQFQGGLGSFGGGGGGFFRRGIDEDTLIEIAAITGGEYYSAESADALHDVFESLPTAITTYTETTEVAFVFAALGALLATAALLLSLRWHTLL